MTQESDPQSPAVDMDLRVKQFVALRDKKKAIKKKHEEELKPYEEAMDALETFIMSQLQAMNANNIATDAGTAYLSTRVSATVGDAEAFWNEVLSSKNFDLIDKRANAPAVTAYVEKHGHAPAGINYSTMLTLGVRRS